MGVGLPARADLRPLKWLTLVDEYTREGLAREVERGMTAKAVAAVLAGVARERGGTSARTTGRSSSPRGSGPGCPGQAWGRWTSRRGAPWENGYAESFNGKVRDELLNAQEFGSLLEAKGLAKGWRREYNHVRPHSALGYRTPAEDGGMVPRAGAAQRSRPEEPSVTVDPTLAAPGP